MKTKAIIEGEHNGDMLALPKLGGQSEMCSPFLSFGLSRPSYARHELSVNVSELIWFELLKSKIEWRDETTGLGFACFQETQVLYLLRLQSAFSSQPMLTVQDYYSSLNIETARTELVDQSFQKEERKLMSIVDG